MKSFASYMILIIGMIAALGLYIFGSEYLKPWIPEAGVESIGLMEGIVTAKIAKPGIGDIPDDLLITLNTDQGASLVTFTERVDEVALLVDKGDRVTLAVATYRPFIENPVIKRVEKVSGQVCEPAGARAAAPAGDRVGIENASGASGAREGAMTDSPAIAPTGSTGRQGVRNAATPPVSGSGNSVGVGNRRAL
jgi:hypothetical protein